MIGTMTPRRLSTPRTYWGCFGRCVISDQPLISRTAMMSTPYWSSPMAKLMTWVGRLEDLPPVDSPTRGGLASRADGSAVVACIWVMTLVCPHWERLFLRAAHRGRL